MTQPVPDTTVVPTQAPPAAPATISLDDQALIASELGGTLDEARAIKAKLRQFYKFAFGDGIAWEVGLAVPGNPALAVFAAFNTDFMSADTDGLPYTVGDCRFYVRPVDTRLPDPLAAVFTCYTVNKTTPTMIAEQLTLETFIREVGRELYNLAVVQGQVEEGERLTREEWEAEEEEEED